MLKNLFIVLLLLFSLSACSGKIGNLFTVYKIDVQQGNALEQDKVDELQQGMSKEQVRFLLGTPLIQDSFHPDRWDYVYDFIPGYGERERRHVAVYFDGDKVSEIIHSDSDSITDEEVLECGLFSRFFRPECAR